MYNPFNKYDELCLEIKRSKLKIKGSDFAVANATSKLKIAEIEYRQTKITSDQWNATKADYDTLVRNNNKHKKTLRSLKNEAGKIEATFILLALGLLGGAAIAVIFGPQIVAGATVAFLAAKPYLIALGAMVWAGLVKLGTTIAAHKVAASIVAGTATVLTPALYFKQSREALKCGAERVGDAVLCGLEQFGKAYSPYPSIYVA